MKGSGEVWKTQLENIQTTFFPWEVPASYPDSVLASKFCFLLLISYFLLLSNFPWSQQRFQHLPPNPPFLSAEPPSSTQRASQYSAPLVGLLVLRKAIRCNSCPAKHTSQSHIHPLLLLILIRTQCSNCCWWTGGFAVCSQLFITITTSFCLLREENLTARCCVSQLTHMALRKIHQNYPFRQISWTTLKA